MWMVWAWWETKEVLFDPWKKWGVQNQIRKLIVEEKEINDHKDISKNIKAFYETLFKRNFPKTNVEKQWFLDFLSTETLTN